MQKKIFIAGGAGCIGSNFVDVLLGDEKTELVTVFDNFSSGKREFLAHHLKDSRLKIVAGDIKDEELLDETMRGHETVIHLASNPDIARAAFDPAIDFHEGTLLTHLIVEAMRKTGASRILYASGSGIYGDLGETEIAEDFGPLIPISTYGASKLAGEALIASYGHMFSITGIAFRFGNVVGPRQTHGVGYDFVRKLLANAKELTILGDGNQSKSYVHISDVIAAVLLANERVNKPFEAFNVATGDYITVKEIADLAIEKVVGAHANVKCVFSGGERGWKGDVPVIRLNTDKIRALGWRCRYSSKEAMALALDTMLLELKTPPARA